MSYFFSSLALLFLLSCPAASDESRILTNHYEDEFRSPRTLVLTFDHCVQGLEAGDPFYNVGNEKVYYHFITPIFKGDNSMFRYDLVGYAYGPGKALDITWCGYNYNGPHVGKPVNINRNKGEYELEVRSYYKNDGRLVIVFGPIEKHCNGFELYYQGHFGSKFRKGEERENYSIIVAHIDRNLPWW